MEAAIPECSAGIEDSAAEVTGTEIAYLPNPRREAEENELNVRNDQFLALGLQPTTLSEGLLEECTDIAARFRHRADPTKIVARSVWRAGMETADDLLTAVHAQAEAPAQAEVPAQQ